MYFSLGKTDKPETVKMKSLFVPATSYYQKKNVGEAQNAVVKLASAISNNDFDWILTLEAENGLWDMQRKHPYANSNGTRDYACGLNSQYHWKFISSPDFQDTEKVLKYCYDDYTKRKTAFYGYFVRNKNKNKFQLITLNNAT